MREPATLKIADMARRTGIPITTLRFYERELPDLFRIRKTRGGHRRYGEEDVARFLAVRIITATQGVPLSQVRRVMMSRGANEALREELDLLRQVQESGTRSLEELDQRLRKLEARLREIEAAPPRKRGWFSVRKKPRF